MGGAAAGAGVGAVTGDLYAYRRIANDLRTRITTGDVKPGGKVPSEVDLIRRYEVARETARRALQVLRTEGLIEFRMGFGNYVRHQPEHTTRSTCGTGTGRTPGCPPRQERLDLGLSERMPVLVVARASGEVDVYDADGTELCAGPA